MKDSFDTAFESNIEPTDETETAIETVEEASETVAESPTETEELEEAETPVERTGEEEGGTVPYQALKASRAEIKSLKERLEALESRPEPEAKKPETPAHQAPTPYIPDPIDDPQGFLDYQEARTRQIALQTKLELSEELAVEKHGEDAVKAAQAWAEQKLQSDPTFLNDGLKLRHPYEWLIATHKRESLVQDMLADPDEWAKRRVAELSAQTGTDFGSPDPLSQPLAEKSKAPRSIVHTTSARKDVVKQSSAESFNAAFVKR